MARDMHATYPVPHTTQKPVDAHPRGARLVFHGIAAATMVNGFFGLTQLAADKEIPAEYGGFFQYLTIVGVLVMVTSAFSDMLPAVPVVRTIKRFFMLFALPVEITISSIYWPLVLFAPHLMFPPNPDLATTPEPSAAQPADLLFRIPMWMDLSMHAWPAVSLLVDFFAFESRYRPPVSTLGALAMAGSFGTAYSLWIEHAATINGKFPYPFLTLMNPNQRIVMYAGSSLFATIVFWLLNAAHR